MIFNKKSYSAKISKKRKKYGLNGYKGFTLPDVEGVRSIAGTTGSYNIILKTTEQIAQNK